MMSARKDASSPQPQGVRPQGAALVFAIASLSILLWSAGLWPTVPAAFAQPNPINESPFSVNETATGEQVLPAVAAEPGGDFVVTWELDGGDVFWRAFDSSGSATGSETAFGSAAASPSTGPAIGMAADGGFVLAWANDLSSVDAIRLLRYNSSGTTVGAAVQVNVVTTGGRDAPDVAVGASGQAFVVWQDESDGSYDILARLYDSAGSVVGSPFTVNAVTTGDQFAPAVAAFEGTDRFVVSWHVIDGGDPDIRARLIDSSGAPVGADLTVNSVTTGSQDQSDVAADDDEFVVVWRSGYGSDDTDGASVQLQLFDSGGSMVGSQMEVNSYTTGDQQNPAVAMDDCGFTVVWDEDRLPGKALRGSELLITGRRFDRAPPPPPMRPAKAAPEDTGVVGTADFTISDSGAPSNPDIADASNGDFVVVWQAESGGTEEIFGRVYEVGLIFEDGFETGDTSSWATTVP